MRTVQNICTWVMSLVLRVISDETVSYTHLISTGGSVIEVVNVPREAGAQVLGIASIFTYGLQKGIDRMNDAQVKNVSLSNYGALVEVALEQNYIQPDDVKKLQAFRQNPSDAGWMNL